jgi:hypothetical protein
MGFVTGLNALRCLISRPGACAVIVRYKLYRSVLPSRDASSGSVYDSSDAGIKMPLGNSYCTRVLNSDAGLIGNFNGVLYKTWI